MAPVEGASGFHGDEEPLLQCSLLVVSRCFCNELLCICVCLFVCCCCNFCVGFLSPFYSFWVNCVLSVHVFLLDSTRDFGNKPAVCMFTFCGLRFHLYIFLGHVFIVCVYLNAFT